MAPSYSKIYHRVAHKKNCFVVMAPSYSKFYPRVAHKRHATLQWRFPFLNFTHERNATLQWLLPTLNCICGPQKACRVAIAYKLLPILNFTLGWPTKGMLRCGQLVGCCWRRWQVAVGWLVSRFFLRQGVHTKMLISWQARVLERKCRFRGAGVGGGAAPPQQHTRS